MSCAHLTAIARKHPSAPMKWLEANGKLIGKTLDYGCGKGFDADYFHMDKYDPFYFKKDFIQNNEYDTITCNFVLNTIESNAERDSVLLHIKNCLKPGGKAYVSIRSDKSKLNGYTSKGTYQTYVHMNGYWNLIHKGSGYELYELQN